MPCARYTSRSPNQSPQETVTRDPPGKQRALGGPGSGRRGGVPRYAAGMVAEGVRTPQGKSILFMAVRGTQRAAP